VANQRGRDGNEEHSEQHQCPDRRGAAPPARKGNEPHANQNLGRGQDGRRVRGDARQQVEVRDLDGESRGVPQFEDSRDQQQTAQPEA
jgi:hypothetical protein